MSLKERLLADMKEAMKSGAKKKLSVIRMARAAIKNVEIDERKDLSDEEIIAILAKEVKQRRESIEEYRGVGKEDVATDLEEEINILNQYLPESLSEAEIVDLVEETIEEVGAEDMSDMGAVMGAIMPQVRGRADGNKVNNLVRERLQ
ncbi:GatB/YqeY domain-containing protein [Fuchsiella alkaliacetigena]|uniref:GatB/YqeY domain-containing protein n=1 Tax=Fuchsiella alkaliacetigena TaxID=957042 RepID=UPI00200B6E07|nr:GatB/YqeY domain-containing protein [Fuchsiella alkaliacetigena]MCK8825154.1 GatB/YqeY domain-containing protein [Fuchsiella alkaliacetigena]